MDDIPEKVKEPMLEGIKQPVIKGLKNDYNFDNELIEIAWEEIPLTAQGGSDAIEYRLAVIREFVESSGYPAKRKDGRRYRTRDQSRLDRAFTRISSVTDKCENTIRNACVHSIYSGENQTEQFLKDLKRIEQRLNDL